MSTGNKGGELLPRLKYEWIPDQGAFRVTQEVRHSSKESAMRALWGVFREGWITRDNFLTMRSRLMESRLPEGQIDPIVKRCETGKGIRLMTYAGPWTQFIYSQAALRQIMENCVGQLLLTQYQSEELLKEALEEFEDLPEERQPLDDIPTSGLLEIHIIVGAGRKASPSPDTH
ncbi:MAG: hypothetical protein HN726_00195 [Candidatus Magasanikbacteria bacterium]|jgi:hypothetical protein|nr:hypothetical protein [Candidatus Magasanikbacteria bacterium]MBT4221077.1 hypothetical protein [Candidatus Magasanikbacteria bacterium]MBT4350579.1 hypothetical protein [Candidatus Magasanikbacteria bacterium]MBT4542122.1 hypothetical protein [Candidatus Magasanikbacteria bacterium]MBT6253244.1 hypothetical protein [Candidatus Magasanikbacteria bacterium]